MDDLRVDRFLAQAEARSVEDLIEAVDRITATLEKMKVEPYVHVTNKTPDIKLPDVIRKDTININFPTHIILFALAAPYILLIGMFLLVRFLPIN